MNDSMIAMARMRGGEMTREAERARLAGRASRAWHARLRAMRTVFLRVWQHLDKLAGMPEDGQRAWIFTVARNLSIDAGRHQRTAAGTEQALARGTACAGVAGAATAAPASVAVIEAERVAVVSEAISRLPEQQRMALTMAAAGTMTSAEIAAALGVPAGTVRYWLSLARRTLAEALDRYDEQAEES
jgi:RNA polymerase sigma-70 factor (ECF subfamily)